MNYISTSKTAPIHYLEATTLAALIRTKQLSSREVVQAHLDRTEAVNPKINAVVTLMGEAALEAADAADKAVASGAELGPLHGVPFSIKDALDTAGILTQRGSKLFTGNIPDKDATAVARFKAAGGIPLMKTNLPEFSGWTESDNRVTGRTNNPWNFERTPGGSLGHQKTLFLQPADDLRSGRWRPNALGLLAAIRRGRSAARTEGSPRTLPVDGRPLAAKVLPRGRANSFPLARRKRRAAIPFLGSSRDRGRSRRQPTRGRQASNPFQSNLNRWIAE
jgi:hypothetical protein